MAFIVKGCRANSLLSAVPGSLPPSDGEDAFVNFFMLAVLSFGNARPGPIQIKTACAQHQTQWI